MRSLVLAALAAAVILCTFLGVAAFMRAKTKGRYFSLSALFAGATLYAGFYLFEITRTNLNAVLACIGFEYVGIAILIVAFFFMVRDFKGFEPASPWLVVLVSIIPTLALVAIFTTRYHNLMYIAPRMTRVNGFTVLASKKGFLYVLNMLYIYSLLSYGVISFAQAMFKGPGVRRAQAAYMLAGSLVPFIASIIYLLGRSPANADPTPLALAASGIFYIAGFFKYRLFDIHPIARDMVFDHMREAVIVVGLDGLILDSNRSARVLFPVLTTKPASQSFSDLYASCPGLKPAFEGGNHKDTIRLEPAGSEERRFETQSTDILDGRENRIGTLFILYDVTERESLQERLHDLASLDELTRVSNRRKFYEQAGIELDRANRHGRPIGFAMMDMNGFKEINDRFGHRAGDDALRLAARLCSDALRSCDVIGRVGGDEFAFVFPESDEAGAAAAVEKMRRVINSATFSSGATMVLLSAAFGSVGSAGPLHPDIEEFMAVADRRMYADKARLKAGLQAQP